LPACARRAFSSIASNTRLIGLTDLEKTPALWPAFSFPEHDPKSPPANLIREWRFGFSEKIMLQTRNQTALLTGRAPQPHSAANRKQHQAFSPKLTGR
jgi:hypothetical protein